MRDILLDPEIIEGLLDPTDPQPLRLFKDCVRIVRSDPSSRLQPFLAKSIWTRSLPPRTFVHLQKSVGSLLPVLDELVRANPQHPRRARLATMPATIPVAWEQSLFEATPCDPTLRWRSATVLVPQARAGWGPRGAVNVLGLAATTLRELVSIEHAETDRHFFSDVNPWLLGNSVAAARQSMVGRQRFHMLPIPPEIENTPHGSCLLNTSLLTADGDWVQAHEQSRRLGWIRGEPPNERAFYVPSGDWTALTVSRESWRANTAFPRGQKDAIGGPLAGFLDFQNQVWWWDVEEHHWDVQDADPRKPADYITVSHTGRVLGRTRES